MGRRTYGLYSSAYTSYSERPPTNVYTSHTSDASPELSSKAPSLYSIIYILISYEHLFNTLLPYMMVSVEIPDYTFYSGGSVFSTYDYEPNLKYKPRYEFYSYRKYFSYLSMSLKFYYLYITKFPKVKLSFFVNCFVVWIVGRGLLIYIFSISGV